MDLILVPGLWLDGSCWDNVTPILHSAGHRVHPLTLPGLESQGASRAAVSLRDQVDAVVREIDGCSPQQKVVLVGHSAGCGICYAAVDARPDRVARAIYVGGFPSPDGSTLVSGFEISDGVIPFPDWSTFGAEDLVDLTDELRAEFRSRAVPSPACMQEEALQLSDERRHEVPVTAVCPEYTAADLREWIAGGAAPVQEFAHITDVEYVDLPTGHWPQFTRPDDLAHVIIDAVPALS